MLQVIGGWEKEGRKHVNIYCLQYKFIYMAKSLIAAYNLHRQWHRCKRSHKEFALTPNILRGTNTEYVRDRNVSY